MSPYLITWFAVIVLSSCESAALPTHDPVITTSLGKILGSQLTSTTGKEFFAYRGIRYANPPIGNLRFKNTQPVDKWDEVFDATKDGPMCPQPDVNLTDISEDCLRINVYTAALPTNANVKKPVILYIHPGGFYSKSGQSWNFAGPEYFMDRDIVFVTINYRLGMLGFLSTGTAEAPGNAGLKDQVMALKWIQSEISHFGGDPDSVTLLGYGAGAMSITMHMVSTMSRGLFHKAIVMSGSITGQWNILSNQLDLAKQQARLLNCPEKEIKEMVDCLMKKDAIDFGTSLNKLFQFGTNNPTFLMKPVIENDFGQERFLLESPIDAVVRGDFMKIPIITGITKDEFADQAIETLTDDVLRYRLDSNFNKWGPVNFLYERDTEFSETVSEWLRAFYLGSGSLSLKKSLNKLVKLYSDAIVGFAAFKFALFTANHTKVYQYRMSYKSRYSHTYYPDERTPYGVVHYDDLQYLLTGSSTAPTFTEEYPERITVERLSRMWTNFAYNSDPINPSDDYLKNIRWEPFDLKGQAYLDIGEDLVSRERMYLGRYDAWDDLFLFET